MNQKRAHEVAETCRQWENNENWHNTPEMKATIVLDDRVAELEADVSRLATMSIKKNTENSSLILKVAELEAQRDVPRKTLRMLLDILENINIDELRAELAKYDKDLPGFKDIIGLYADKNQEEPHDHSKRST